MEGEIPPSVSKAVKSRGERPSGDLVPWLLSAQFLQPDLTQMKGVRVVRVATHPDYQVETSHPGTNVILYPTFSTY